MDIKQGVIYLEELYKKLYLYLFNRVSDAVSQLESGHCEEALDTLAAAQIKTEEMYISNGVPEPAEDAERQIKRDRRPLRGGGLLLCSEFGVGVHIIRYGAGGESRDRQWQRVSGTTKRMPSTRMSRHFFPH